MKTGGLFCRNSREKKKEEKEMERLDKFLTSQNICTRKETAQLVKKGLVTVDGVCAKDPGQKLDPEQSRVTVEGKEIAYRRRLYLMMNKPRGVLSASQDKQRKTVLDLLPPELFRRGLFPAGRLDKDTTGLMLITDDGELAHRMLSPKSHVYKRYEARLSKRVSQEDIAAFEKGISQGGEAFAPARLWAEDTPNGPGAIVEIREGKFHQIKRMFEARDNRVLTLKRLKIGGLSLDDTLGEGEVRVLSEAEVKQIFDGKLY